MNIVYLINQFPPNVTAGLGRYVESLAPHLVERDRLAVFTVNDGTLPAVEAHGNLTVHRPMGRLLRAAFRRRRVADLNRTRRSEFLLLAANVMAGNLRQFRGIRRLHRRRPVDVIAVHDVTNFVGAFLCHAFLRVPLVFHVHTTEYSLAPRRSVADPLRIGRAIERRLGRIAARVVVPSPEIRDQLVADGWRPEGVEVVPLGNPLDGVPAAEPDPAPVRRRLGLSERDDLVLFVGRLEVQKGIFGLVEAMRAVVDAHPRAVLVVVGQGDRARVEALAREHGVSGRVVLADGFLDRAELVDWYAAAEVCVFPSLFEPFGLVAVEAMALGRPVLLGDGFSRLFAGTPARPAARYAAAADPAALAVGLLELLGDPELRRTLGANGRRLVAERFDWRTTARGTLAVYRAAAGSSGAGTRGPARHP